jgi:hypothetical protein
MSVVDDYAANQVNFAKHNGMRNNFTKDSIIYTNVNIKLIILCIYRTGDVDRSGYAHFL